MGNSQNINAQKVVDFNELVQDLKQKNVYIIYGFGDKSMFRDIDLLKDRVKKIAEKVRKNSVFLYFGDVVNEQKPDVGYVYKLLQEYNPSIELYMIQIDMAKSWGISKDLRVSKVFWHKDYLTNVVDKDGKEYCKYGGFNPETDEPCSNTKIWVDLVKAGVKIRRAYILGGGPLTAKEMRLLIALRIRICFYPFRRRYLGDGKTPVPDKPTKEEAYGDTNIYIFNNINM
jgi:hypothetical protein